MKAHILDWSAYTEWRKSSGKVVYVDTVSFTHLELAYLPANTTGLCQPADLIYNAQVQQQYAIWFNNQPDKFSIPRGEKLVKITEILDEVSPKIIKAAWNSSELTSLHTKEETDDETKTQLIQNRKNWKK